MVEEKMNKIIICILLIMLMNITLISPKVSADPVVDQCQEVDNLGYKIILSDWQEFIPTMDRLVVVEVKVSQNLVTSTSIRLSIEKPFGNILTYKELPAISIPYGNYSNWVIFDVPDINLTPGETYFIKLSTLKSPPLSEYIWCAGEENPYRNGTSSRETDDDFCFRTWSYKGKSKDIIDNEKKLLYPIISRLLDNYRNIFTYLRQLLFIF